MRKRAEAMQYWQKLAVIVRTDITYTDDGEVKKGKITILIEEQDGPGNWEIVLKDLPITKGSAEMTKLGPLVGRKLGRFNDREVTGVISFIKKQVLLQQDLPKVKKKKT